MKKKFGILIIAFGAVFSFYEDAKGSPFIILLISFPLYIIGQMMRTNLIKMRRSGLRWIWAYVYGVILIPGLLLSLEGYERLKENAFSNNHFIIFETASNQKMNGFSILFILILMLLLAFPFYDTTLKIKAGIAMGAIIVMFIYAGYQYVMWMDYRGVHEVDGLITHPWKGKEEIIPYTDVEQIVIRPFVRPGSISDPSIKAYFGWHVIFVTEDAQEISYRLTLNKFSLARSNAVKQLAHSKGIPFHILSMNEEQFKEFDLQLELNDLQKEPYYQFFEIEGL